MLAYVAGETLHAGTTVAVEPSLHDAVATYCTLPVSFTEEGPAMKRSVKVAAGGGGAMIAKIPSDPSAIEPSDVEVIRIR